MHIDSYQFGEIVIDGTAYTTDCLIFAGNVHPDWWRKQGHSLSIDDLEPVLAAKTAVLIVGCGASGLMKVPQETRQAIRQEDIELEVLDTQKAVQRFNELATQGQDFAAALHLTC